MNPRFYYTDGSMWSGNDPRFAPARGVVCIVMEDPDNGRRIQSHCDYYVYRDGFWVGLEDLSGLIDFLIEQGWTREDLQSEWNVMLCLMFEPGLVKFGRTMVRTEAFTEIFMEAEKDPDFPPRTGWRKGEYRVKLVRSDGT